MEKSKYDEFGNYIGPALDDEGDSEADDSDAEEYDIDERQSVPPEEDKMMDQAVALATEGRSVVPHEDKQLYPSAEEVYGNVKILVQEEDMQPITEPIITPAKPNTFDVLERALPETSFSFEYVRALMTMPKLTRLVTFCGHLHHGKTSLCDILVTQTHLFDKPLGQVIDAAGNATRAAITGPERATLRARKQEARTRDLRFTDCRADEQERGVSIKASPVSLVLPDSRGKHHLINVMDAPGHINFIDEAVAALRISDGAVLCVDLLEGPMLGTRKVVHSAISEGLDLVLVLTCIDRLVLELRLPPADAYHKIRYILNEVNEILKSTAQTLGKPAPRPFDPACGNVAFASGRYSFIFSLESFARMYRDQKLPVHKMDYTKPGFHYQQFAKFLWGDIWFNPQTRKFQKQRPSSDEMGDQDEEPQRSFVQFILEPLYKIIAHVVGEERPTLQPTLEELGVFLEPDAFNLDTRSLLRLVCSLLFDDSSALVDMIVRHIKSPVDTAESKVRSAYSGDQDSDIAKGMRACDPQARLMIHTTKNYHRPNDTCFDVFGRVMSGTVKKGSVVKVLGEKYSLDDDEDMLVRDVTHLWIYEGRYRVEVPEVPAGNWVLIGGVDPSVKKTATLTSLERQSATGDDDQVEIFRKLEFPTCSVVRVACEPLIPSELPKMVEGLRKIAKSYPLLTTKVEDSGEHVILTTGELAADCALHDLRRLYGDLEMRCADPVVSIAETIIDSSSMKAFGDTPNNMNRIAFLAEPLEPGLAAEIQNGIVSPSMPARQLAEHLKSVYEWDTLAARSVWAFSSDRGPNMLLNDILPSVERGLEERKQVESVKDFIVHGFQWATREGPLLEEQVRNVKMKLLEANLAAEPIHRNGGQIIPTARRVAYSSMLLATPRLMEPMFYAEITCPADCVPAVLNVLSRRRGHMGKDLPNPGTPLETIVAYLPGVDSFGFETDIRTHTSGQAFVLTTFDRWEIMPGDPLDSSILLRPLEPSPVPHLAREFLLKTRRRKGLAEDVSVAKFFDPAMIQAIEKANA